MYYVSGAFKLNLYTTRYAVSFAFCMKMLIKYIANLHNNTLDYHKQILMCILLQ